MPESYTSLICFTLPEEEDLFVLVSDLAISEREILHVPCSILPRRGGTLTVVIDELMLTLQCELKIELKVSV